LVWVGGIVAVAVMMTLTGCQAEAPVPVPCAASAKSRPATAANRVLVVTNNLHSDSEDEIRQLSEARILAQRVLDDVDCRPDILLLQEVVRKSARRVAETFTRMTSDHYVAVRSSPESWDPVGRQKVVNTETAIVVNRSTMRLVDEGGWMRTPYLRRDAVGTLVVRRHAHLMVAERKGGVRMALVSLHWVRPSTLRTDEIAHAYQSRWAMRIAETLDNGYPRANVKVIGGDFNQNRCVFEPSNNCDPLTPYYQALRDPRYGYVDTVFEMHKKGGVDYLFSTGDVLDAGVDDDYDKDAAEGDRSRWYSDHRFRWALLAPVS
jgi:hypothetical protein